MLSLNSVSIVVTRGQTEPEALPKGAATMLGERSLLLPSPKSSTREKGTLTPTKAEYRIQNPYFLVLSISIMYNLKKITISQHFELKVGMSDDFLKIQVAKK